MNYSLEELSEQITNLLSNSKCSCHFINPHKTRLILWKTNQTYCLRIGLQKFTAYSLTDKNGETYWKFSEYSKEEKPTAQLTNPDPITKFEARQKQTEQINHESNSEPKTASSQSS